MNSKSGLMAGKRGLIMGVANDRSIAWGIAKAVHDAGAEVAFTYQGEALLKRVKPLAESLGSTLVVPCEVTDDASLDAKGQTEQILKENDRLLALGGTDKSKIVSATIWVTDIRNREPMNVAWKAWTGGKNLPARACIEAKLADPLFDSKALDTFTEMQDARVAQTMAEATPLGIGKAMTAFLAKSQSDLNDSTADPPQ